MSDVQKVLNLLHDAMPLDQKIKGRTIYMPLQITAVNQYGDELKILINADGTYEKLAHSGPTREFSTLLPLSLKLRDSLGRLNHTIQLTDCCPLHADVAR